MSLLTKQLFVNTTTNMSFTERSLKMPHCQAFLVMVAAVAAEGQNHRLQGLNTESESQKQRENEQKTGCHYHTCTLLKTEQRK